MAISVPEPAPKRDVGEHPLDYIERVADYLSEPDRRRLGDATAVDIRRAIHEAREMSPWIVSIVGTGTIRGDKTVKLHLMNDGTVRWAS